MAQEYIELRGARENNLKNVSLRIPKRTITVFTGVSGSGKSSVVFDTIATEAQRLLYENFSLFVRNFLPRYAQPEADAIENLGMAVVVDQRRLGGGSHSTVGTVTDISPLLRLLFSRLGTPHVGYSNAFSFNDPQGMCPECQGVGKKLTGRTEGFLDMSRSLNEGAVLAPVFSAWERDAYRNSGFFDNDKKLKDFTAEELELLMHGKARKFQVRFGSRTVNLTYMGIVEKFAQSYIKRDIKSMSERTRKLVTPYLTYGPCPLCKGARLSQAALACRVEGHGIAELSSREVGELVQVVRSLGGKEAAPIVASLAQRLEHLVDIGLDYLSLDRETDTLSGGESQRVKIVKHLGSSLVDVMYIFDEPSIGMHPRDVHRMNELLVKLRDKGNTVIVVEHDPDVIRAADHVVDLGPGAGRQGGEIVYQGTYVGLVESDTSTGRLLRARATLKSGFRAATGKIPITGAAVNNLKSVSVDIPRGVLTVVTGVAGSGKSSLINEVFLAQHPEAVAIDQSAVAASSRSNPATYTGVLDDIRKAFAAANRVSASLFSFNSKGACPNCQGSGVIYTDLAFLSGVKLRCEICEGRRFKDEVLAYRLEGKTITDVLAMTVSEALASLRIPAIARRLQAMSDVGLDYLTLGQPLSTLSGGECQRIKLAAELHKKGSIYVMDEPTTGLHLSDVGKLLAIMDRLVDGGNSVIVIEHNMQVVSWADWIIDMGPEGGHRGGEVIFEGTPRDLLGAERSQTARYLRAAVGTEG